MKLTNTFFIDFSRHLIQSGGQELEEFYPYVGYQHANCSEEWGKMRVRVEECFSFDLESEDKIRHALVKYGPLVGGESLL